MEQHEAEEQQVENLTGPSRSVQSLLPSIPPTARLLMLRSPTRRAESARLPNKERAQRRALVETCDDCIQGTVIGPPSPSFITGQPSSSMLDSWLKEELQPGGIVKRIPEGIHVLVPMMVDPDGVLSLCQKVRDTKGAAVVALDTNESHVQAFFEKTAGWNFTVETLQYEPHGTWTLAAKHLTRPCKIHRHKLTAHCVRVRDGPVLHHAQRHSQGSFHRVWDQLVHTPPAQRAEWMLRF